MLSVVKFNFRFVAILTLVYTCLFSYQASALEKQPLIKFSDAEQRDTGWGGTAFRAVDNNTNGTYKRRSVSHTASNKNTWWKGQFDGAYTVSKVVVHNRTDSCCASRLIGSYILVSNKNLVAPGQEITKEQISSFKADAEIAVSAPIINLSDSTYTWNLPPNTQGKFVYIVNLNNYLQLAEVEAFGEKMTPVDDSSSEQTNFDPLITFSTAEQRDTGWGGAAFRAIDNNTNGTYKRRSVSHTASNKNTWWKGQFDDAYTVSKVVVHNRTDSCCASRLIGSYILVSNKNLVAPGQEITKEQISSFKADAEIAVSAPIINLSDSTYTWNLPPNTQGKFVYIVNLNNHLQLAEVEAFGEKVTNNDDTSTEKNDLLSHVGEALDVLIIGPKRSRDISRDDNRFDSFNIKDIAMHLDAMLKNSALNEHNINQINVVPEEFDDKDWVTRKRSLLQYYYFPDSNRHAKKISDGNYDFVVILGNQSIISTTPEIYTMGVNKIATKAIESGAKPLLLQQWPGLENKTSLEHFIYHTLQTANGSGKDIKIVPAALAWSKLANKVSPNSVEASYLAAASVYSTLFKVAAPKTRYLSADQEDEIANTALTESNHTQGTDDFLSQHPYVKGRTAFSSHRGYFKQDRVHPFRVRSINSSTESGIERKLYALFLQSSTMLNDKGPTIQYARGNGAGKTTWENRPGFGFPWQTGNKHDSTNMLFSIDSSKQYWYLEDHSDVGMALMMQNQMKSTPSLYTTIPTRTIYAHLHEQDSNAKAITDGYGHMTHEMLRAIASYIYTHNTGRCIVDDEKDPALIGYQIAYKLMNQTGVAPCFRMMSEKIGNRSNTKEPRDGDESIWANSFEYLSPTKPTILDVSFVTKPVKLITIDFTVDSKVSLNTHKMNFDPNNHAVKQKLTASLTGSCSKNEKVIIKAKTQSEDKAYDGLAIDWYLVCE